MKINFKLIYLLSLTIKITEKIILYIFFPSSNILNIY